MASSSNSTPNINYGSNLTGNWEDVKDYTSAIITLKNVHLPGTSSDASGTVEWAHAPGRQYPGEGDIIAKEQFNYSDIGAKTFQFDHRARWFRVKYTADPDVSYALQTLYKKAPTELKIVDDSANVVSVNSGVNGNSLYTVLTDVCGTLLRTTAEGHTTGNALYTHLADASGISLATTVANVDGFKSLFVGLRDGSNNALTTTGPNSFNNALYVRPGDSAGVAQASTINVQGASTAGVALFAALSDNCGFQITTTKTDTQVASNRNALFVHLTDSSGRSITQTNPLPVISTVETVGAKTFDISNGLQANFVVPLDMSTVPTGYQLNLYNLFVYNDSQTTVFLKVHDVSLAGLQTVGLSTSVGTYDASLDASLALLSGGQSLKYNLTVQPGKCRDLAIPGGATFNTGIAFRATARYAQGSTISADPDAVFISGTYTVDAK